MGTTAGDQVGGGVPSGSVFALTNGNYVVQSPLWDNGDVQDAGAVTLGNGSVGATGSVSPLNSLVGSSPGDEVGLGYGGFGFGELALANGNYVIASPLWDHGDVADAGAVTFGNGQTGVVGAIHETNSLIGSAASDQLGGGGSGGLHYAALPNGNYVFGSPIWDNGDVSDAGAVILGNGSIGTTGVLSPDNSLVGNHPDDRISDNPTQVGVVVLDSGNYLVSSPSWDNGDLVDAGAVTFGDASMGVSGAVDATNSTIGHSANSGLKFIVSDNVNQSFYVRFLANGGGRVVAGSQIDGFAHPWHLALEPLDVNNDAHVAANDVVAIINYINAGFTAAVAANAQLGGPYGFLDVTGDDFVAANDALAVINAINAGEEGEGEQAAQSARSNVQGQESAVDNALMLLLAMDVNGQPGRRRAT